jgi:uncharacterized protein YkwD
LQAHRAPLLTRPSPGVPDVQFHLDRPPQPGGLLALLLALTLVVATPPSAAEAARGRSADEAAAESALHSHHNAVRGGIGGLQRSGDLDAVARSWADTMAARGTLSHNPNYSSQITNWSRVAENVGFVRDPSQTPVQLAGRIAERYMGSSGHRANILTAAFTQVGIGMTVGSDGSLWSVVVFRAPASGRRRSGGSSDAGGSSSAATTSRSAPATASGNGKLLASPVLPAVLRGLRALAMPRRRRVRRKHSVGATPSRPASAAPRRRWPHWAGTTAPSTDRSVRSLRLRSARSRPRQGLERPTAHSTRPRSPRSARRTPSPEQLTRRHRRVPRARLLHVLPSRRSCAPG